MAAADSGAIQTLQKHIEDMRSLVMCKICLKPFYEPYILACGHTYCYGCLNSWFNGNGERRKNKNCPDCRTIVKVQPAPNYLLRDVTHMFIGRTELLPEDETVEEHNREKNEEAVALTKDKSGPGLFKGIFKTHSPPYGPLHGAIRDDEDGGALRCPVCLWELEDGQCAGCGLSLNSSDDDDELELSDSDTDEEDASDASESEGESVESEVPPLARPPQFYGVELDSHEGDADSRFAEDEDQDRYDLHDDFLDNDNEDDADDMDGVHDYAAYPSDAGTPYSEESSQTVDNDAAHGDNGGLFPWQQYQNARPPSHVAWASDSESNDEDTEEDQWADEDDEPIRRLPKRPVQPPRRRAIVISDDEEEQEEAARSASEAPSQPVRIESDSIVHKRSDESGSDSASGSGGGSSADDSASDHSEDSDHTITPPQSSRDRKSRLEAHRARRPLPNHRVTVDLVTPPQHNGRGRGVGSTVARNARRSRPTPVH